MLTYLTTALALSSVLLPTVTAHPGEHHRHEHLSVHERVKRQHAVNKRHAVAKRCEAHIQAFNEERKKQRQKAGGGGGNSTHTAQGQKNTQATGSNAAGEYAASSGFATSYTSLLEATASTAAATSTAASSAASDTAASGNGTEPYYTSIQNATCVLAPEAVEGVSSISARWRTALCSIHDIDELRCRFLALLHPQRAHQAEPRRGPGRRQAADGRRRDGRDHLHATR